MYVSDNSQAKVTTFQFKFWLKASQHDEEDNFLYWV